MFSMFNLIYITVRPTFYIYLASVKKAVQRADWGEITDL